MSSERKRRVVIVALAALVFVAVLVLALVLLVDELLSGAEFTAFVLSFAVLCLAVGFASEIQEVSIAGNVLKLREVKAEALRVVESLYVFRVETLRILMELALKQSGGFASECPVDPRNKAFLRLVGFAREYGCVKQLREDIVQGLDSLLLGQLQVISMRNGQVRRSHEGIISPIDLAIIAMAEDGISETASRRSPRKEVSFYQSEIKESLEEYSRIYQLKLEIISSC